MNSLTTIKSALFTCTLITIFYSCAPESQIKELQYQNIVVISDLSSRIQNKPNKDTIEIAKILQFFKDSCVQPGKKIGDKSAISFGLFSTKTLVQIDLSQMHDLKRKQQFINDSKTDTGLIAKMDNFMITVKNAYATHNNKGLDLISVLLDKIANEDIIKKDTELKYGADKTTISYENHLYIFTDGYLEYKNKSVNNQFYFGSNEIKKIRLYCQKNNTDVELALSKEPSLGLTPIFNKKHQRIALHIKETHERDKNEKLQTYSHLLGLRDNEILFAVWKKWADESGFKTLEWEKY